MQTEMWRQVPGFPNYDVSTLGNVRSKTITKTHYRKGVLYERTKQGRTLTPILQTTGYHHVALFRDAEKVQKSVHALVALVFIGPRPDGYVVNHIDGNKTNNSVANLEYITPKENAEHACKLGLYECGEDRHCAVLTEADVRTILRMRKEGMKISAIHASFAQVNISTIKRICARIIWKHIDPDSE